MVRALFAAALLALGTLSADAASRLLVRPGDTFAATVIRVVDGDTVRVTVPAWSASPFETVDIRILGIDAPETRKPPGKCKAELALGLKAKALAMTLAQPGQAVTLTFRGLDKFGSRVDGAITLPDGRDFGALMLGSGRARPYSGRGPKPKWCGK